MVSSTRLAPVGVPTYAFTDSPPTPPPYGREGPTLPERREHEPILRAATPKAVGSVRSRHASAGEGGRQVLLDRIVRQLTVGVRGAVGRDQEEQVVVRAHRSPQDMLLSEGQPGPEVLAHIDVGGVRLVVDFVVIPCRPVNRRAVSAVSTQIYI